MNRKDREVYDEIKNKFGSNRLDDERFSDRSYVDGLKTNENGDFLESIFANPDVLSEEVSPYFKTKEFEDTFRIDVIKEALKSLTDKQMEVLTMLSHGRSLAVIAEKMKISKSMVRTHLERAKKKILGIYDTRKGVSNPY